MCTHLSVCLSITREVMNIFMIFGWVGHCPKRSDQRFERSVSYSGPPKLLGLYSQKVLDLARS